jgi:acetyl esterase/lipase
VPSAEPAPAPIELPLYEGPIPNALPVPDTESAAVRPSDGKLLVSNVSRPSLTVFPAPAGKRNGAAVIVMPGGGYAFLNIRNGGSAVAERFRDLGFTALLLKYRLPSDATMPRKEIGPAQDAQRAIAVARTRAREWGVDRVGVLGLSAGGHLASFVGTRFDRCFLPDQPGVDLRPDFQVLVYPVISLADGLAHVGSRTALLGQHATAERIAEYSTELHVSPRTPPTFLVHGRDDTAVDYRNSVVFQEALRRHGVPNDLLLYDRGPHGFDAVNPHSSISWIDRAEDWLRSQQLIG